MKTLQPIGSSYRTNYEALNDVLGMKYDSEHRPQGGLFRPKGFSQGEAVWFVKMFRDDHGWLNQKMANGEIWENNANGVVLDENLDWQDPQIKRAAFSRQNPTADWVFEGVFRAAGIVRDASGRRWRKYIPVP